MQISSNAAAIANSLQLPALLLNMLATHVTVNKRVQQIYQCHEEKTKNAHVLENVQQNVAG